jgi:uncharacterized coiled-coil protein SlyX
MSDPRNLDDVEARVRQLEARAADLDARVAELTRGLAALSMQVSRLSDVATTQTYSLERIERTMRQVLDALTKRGG